MGKYTTCANCGAFVSNKYLPTHLLQVHRISVEKPKNINDPIPEYQQKENRKLIEERRQAFQKQEEENTKEIYIMWDYVCFEKNTLVFKIPGMYLKPILVKGVHEGLNSIKKEYFSRLYGKKIYKISYFNGVINPARSRDWTLFLSAIETAINHLNFKFSKSSKIGEPLTKEQLFNLCQISPEKEPYVKFLAELQSEKFKIIPILEVNGKRKEESLIFRFETEKSSILLVWENLKDSRATHVFVTSEKQHIEDLLKVQSLILSSLPDKRAVLHGGYTNSIHLQREVNYLTAVMHDSFYEYKDRIKQIIANF